MSPTDPESIFQQKIPQSYLKLQEGVTDTLKTSDKPPVMKGDEFRYVISYNIINTSANYIATYVLL